jgi:hypothetical protein
MQQQQVFMNSNAESRKKLLAKRPRWNKQAEQDQQKVEDKRQKQFRKLEIYRGRHDRIVEEKAITIDGKDAKDRLIYRIKQKAKRERAKRDEQSL